MVVEIHSVSDANFLSDDEWCYINIIDEAVNIFTNQWERLNKVPRVRIFKIMNHLRYSGLSNKELNRW